MSSGFSDWNFNIIECDVVANEQDWNFKLPCVGKGALYEYDSCTILVTTNESSEWGQLEICLDDDCDPPPYNHWLSHELDSIGFEYILDLYGDKVERFLLENGIAPFQRFYIWLRASYYRDYWGEHDVDFEMEVLDIEPWDVDEIATEWEAFWCRKRLLMPWCQ